MGAKPGGTKGNEQEAEYGNREEGMGNQAGKNGENRGSDERKRSTGEATVRRKREGNGKEETEAE